MPTESLTIVRGLDPNQYAGRAVQAVNLEFMRCLFADPTGTNPPLAVLVHPSFQEWTYGTPAVTDENPSLEGRQALLDYRERFGVITDGKFVGPELVDYEFVEVPQSKLFVIPNSGGRCYNAGMLFKSTFRLPEGAGPEGMPPVSLIFQEHLDIRPDPEDGNKLKVYGRMYLPYNEAGQPIGPGTDRPDDTQHNLVRRQIEAFVAAKQQAEAEGRSVEAEYMPPVRVLARTVFIAAFPGTTEFRTVHETRW